MQRSPKRLLAAGLLLGVVLVLAALLRPRPLSVETAVVVRAPLQEVVEEEGETRVRDRFMMTAPAAGRIARIALQEGDPVSRGTIVALLYPAPLDVRSHAEAAARVSQAEDAQRAAEAAVAAARSVGAQAGRNRTRAQELADRGFLAPAERERAELDATSAQRALESADFRAQAAAHDAELARAALLGPATRPLVLRSPIDGQVLRIRERSERVVAAGEALLELGDLRRLELVADLLSSDAARVHPGDPLLIEGWGGGTLSGCVRRIEPSGYTKVSALGVEEQRVNLVADLTDPPANLGDGFRVELRIVVWETPAALQVPGSALFRRGGGWAVFVLSGGRARIRDIESGHRTPFVVEITRGLRQHEVVISNPGDRLRDGSRVRTSARNRKP